MFLSLLLSDTYDFSGPSEVECSWSLLVIFFLLTCFRADGNAWSIWPHKSNWSDYWGTLKYLWWLSSVTFSVQLSNWKRAERKIDSRGCYNASIHIVLVIVTLAMYFEQSSVWWLRFFSSLLRWHYSRSICGTYEFQDCLL